MPRKPRGPRNSSGDAERRAARHWLNDQAIIHLRRACRLIIILVVVFGILLPMANYTAIRLVVIALALCTIGMVVFTSRAETAPAMLLRTGLAVLLLTIMGTVEVLVTRT